MARNVLLVSTENFVGALREWGEIAKITGLRSRFFMRVVVSFLVARAPYHPLLPMS